MRVSTVFPELSPNGTIPHERSRRQLNAQLKFFTETGENFRAKMAARTKTAATY